MKRPSQSRLKKLESDPGGTTAGHGVDFSSVLRGELFGPLADSDFLDRVLLDEEVGTVVWPNGADFDPAMLYNWSDCGPALAALAATWRP